MSAGGLVADWLTVQDGRLVAHTGKVDLGQRISTALTRIAAQELGLPLDAVDVAPVITGRAPDEGITSGSNSVQESGAAIRLAASTARAALRALAAERLEAAPDALDLRDGLILDPSSNRNLRLIDLWDALPPDLAVDPDAPAEDRPAPPPAPPRGMSEMVRGAYAYVHDLEVPGMLHARVVRPPHANARLSSLDADAVARVEAEGGRVVRDGSFLAIVHPREWEALRAARRLERACVWASCGGLETSDVFAMLEERPRLSFRLEDSKPVEGPLPPPIAATHEAVFHRPYTLHGALAPSAALAEWRDGTLRVNCASQGVYALRESMADALGLPVEAVEIAHAPGSGCYGHNGADDAAFEAALVAIALPETPVLLKWTREEEHGFEPCGPAATVKLAARLEGGRIAAWSGEAFSDTHRGRPRPGPNRAGPARLLASRFREEALAPYVGEPNRNRHGGMHRNLDPIYRVGEKRLVKNLVTGLPLRTSALRTLGATVNVFAIESFMDELAEAAGADPLDFRLAHLDDPRALAVLEALAEAAGLRAPPAEGVGRGIAYAQYKNAQARVAVCVELSVDDAARPRILRAALAADSGRVVDPDGLKAQLEGGFLQGASWALHERVTWDAGGVTSRDWESYPVLRFDAAPPLEVVVLDRPDAPSVGAGEGASGPTVAAIANAIHAATGLRMRAMPFDADALRREALRA